MRSGRLLEISGIFSRIEVFDRRELPESPWGAGLKQKACRDERSFLEKIEGGWEKRLAGNKKTGRESRSAQEVGPSAWKEMSQQEESGLAVNVLVEEEERMFLAGLQFSVEVSDGDESDEASVVIGDGEVPDSAFAHGRAGFFGGGVGGATNDIDGHDFIDACFLGITVFGDDTAEEIALGEDADDLAVVFDDEGTDAVAVHFVGGFVNRSRDVNFPEAMSFLGQELADLSHGVTSDKRDGIGQRRDETFERSVEKGYF